MDKYWSLLAASPSVFLLNKAEFAKLACHQNCCMHPAGDVLHLCYVSRTQLLKILVLCPLEVCTKQTAQYVELTNCHPARKRKKTPKILPHNLPWRDCLVSLFWNFCKCARRCPTIRNHHFPTRTPRNPSVPPALLNHLWRENPWHTKTIKPEQPHRCKKVESKSHCHGQHQTTKPKQQQ